MFSEPAVGGLDSSWNIGTSGQSLSEDVGLSRPSGPVITTGALPVATQQPPTFFPELPPQAQGAWADFPAQAKQPQLPGGAAQLYNSHQIGQHAQEQPAPGSPEALLKQVEEMLKADNSPEVQARLLAIIAAQGKSARLPGQQALPTIAPAAPVQPSYNMSSNPASTGHVTSQAGTYRTQVNSLDPRQAPQRRLGPLGQAQVSAPGQFSNSTSLQAADRLQPSSLPTSMDPYAWPAASSQAVTGLQHIEQARQFMQRAPQLPQQLPGTTLPQERPGKAGSREARRNQQPVRQTGAMSLQQQAQELLPREEEAEPFDFGSYLPSSSTDFAHELSAAQPSSLPQEVLHPWHAPTGHITRRPDLQRNSAGSTSGQGGGQTPVTPPFGDAVGSQTMTQALLEPHAFNHLPVDSATAPFGLPVGLPMGHVPQSAPQQTARVPPGVGRLPGSQATVPLDVGAPNHMVQAALIGAAGRQQPSSPLEARLLRPVAPLRAPPPQSKAAAGRPMPNDAAAAAAGRAAASTAEMRTMYQAASQDSGDGSCGLDVSDALGLQSSAATSQVHSPNICHFDNFT